MKPLFLYTMTSGLGDYVVMGDLMKKLETLMPKARCLMAHRGNPHINLWSYDSPSERFFDVYRPNQVLNLISTLKKFKKSGYTAFGLQMAPGSLQGFFFHLFLKKIRALNFIIDFNLINTDIITSPEGEYILDLHLNQIAKLFKVDIPKEFYQLNLPIKNLAFPKMRNRENQVKIGIHPWSRRGYLPCFVWPFEKWLEVIRFLLKDKHNEVIIFGKDKQFNEFQFYLQNQLGNFTGQIDFMPCDSVKRLIEVINGLDLLISVNTSTVHIGCALRKEMIILCGPSLDLWTPKGDRIKTICDKEALFPGSDKWINEQFPSVSKIKVKEVISHLKCCLYQNHGN